MSNVSNNCLDLVKKFEGYYENAYLCPAKVPTIGYGTTKYANGKKVKLGDKIDKVTATALLEKQVNEHASTIKKYVKVKLSQNQYDALASFQYNLGKEILMKDKALLGYINKSDWVNTTRVMKMYTKGGGKTLKGLVNRRNAEVELFLKK